MKLSESQIQEFYDVGFLVLDSLFSPQEIAKIRSHFDGISKIAQTRARTFVKNGTQFVKEGERIDRVVWCPGVKPDLLKSSHNPKLLNPISQLLDTEE